MTVSSGFFNSVNHDRLYDAEQLSSIFDGLIKDGIYENIGDAFQISVNPEVNNSVLVGTGRAWFDHTWTVNDSVYSIQLVSPNEAMSRIDAIVLDINREQNVRSNSIKYITGTYDANPQKPSLVKSDLHNQYPLAYINIPQGASAVISNSNIENAIGTSECPIVTGVLEALNLDLYTQQLEAEFYEWWDGIKDTLDENTVTFILNQIEEFDTRLEKVENSSIDMDSISEVNEVSFSIISPQTGSNYETGNAYFLPNGSLIWFTRAESNNSYNPSQYTPKTGPYLNALITSKAGSAIKVDSLHNDTGFDGICVLKASTESYPCEVYLATSISHLNPDTNRFESVDFYIYKYVITSDNMITRTLVASNNTSYDSVEITQNDNCNNGVLCSIPAKFDTGANFVAAVHKHSWYDRYYITSWIISSDFAISKTTKSEPTADLEWGTSTGSVHKINPFYCHCICYMNSSKSEIFVSLPDSFMSGYAGGNGKAVFDLAGNYVEAIADNNSEYSSVSEVTVYNKDVEIICNETQFGKFDGSYRPTIISSDTYPLVLEYSNSGNGTITNTLGTSSSSLGVDVSGFTNTGFTLMFPDKKHILQVYSNNNIHYGTLVLKNGGFGFSSNGRQLSRALATIQSVASFYFQERCVYFSEEEKTFGLIIPGSYSTNFTPKTYEIPIGNTGGNSKFYPIVMYVEY